MKMVLHETQLEAPEEFRQRLRRWIHDNISSLSDQKTADFGESDRKRVTAAMYDEGFIGATWPLKYSGRGFSQKYQTIYNEETALVPWALVESSVTVGICAHTLRDFATEEQCLRHIPRMLRGDEAWTQLLSEPGAGSDLASVSTKAELVDDVFVLNGQKVWTSQVRLCEYALALVRTDVAAQNRRAGVSMLIVDLKSPGIDVRPLREMTGEANFNEVFIKDVIVPHANLVGALHDGWRVLLGMLAHERFALSAGTAGRRMDDDAFPRLLDLARRNQRVSEPAVRAAIVSAYISQRLLDLMGIRMREASEAGLSMGPVGSIGKIGTARAAREVAEVACLISGMPSIAWADSDRESEAAARALLHFPATGIAGGTTEIQKNTVAGRVLGLPRDA